MTHPRRRRTRLAFTLIELMITTAIISMMFASGFALHSQFGAVRQRLSQRIDAGEAALRALTRWRRDVALAGNIELADAGRSMTIRFPDPDGPAERVRYHWTDAGHLVRMVQSDAPGRAPREQVLARNVSDVRFQQVGRGYRLAWVTRYDDGMQKWSWHHGGLATPLAAGEEVRP